VEAEDLVINKGGKREIIEQIGEKLPNIRVAVFPETFIVEAIDLSNLTRLVITTQDCDSGGVPNFKGYEESNSFYRVVTSINVVAYTHWSDWLVGNG